MVTGASTAYMALILVDARKGLRYRPDVNSLHRDESATSLRLNEIGRVQLRTTVPLLCDEYRRNRSTGGLILIDEVTNRTVGAAMILEAA